MSVMPKVKACLFDMDGFLINTEDMYTVATNTVLKKYNKPPLTWKIKIQLQGRPGPKAAELVIDWAKLHITVEELTKQSSVVLDKMRPTCQFLPGALELLKHLSETNVPIALATSSAKDKYIAKTNHLREGFDLFGPHVITGDDERIPPGRGKPCPDIWLLALKSINDERAEKGLEIIKPEEVIVFEDGVPGAIGGRDAGAYVVMVPHPCAMDVLDVEYLKEVVGNGEVLTSLTEFDCTKFGL